MQCGRRRRLLKPPVSQADRPRSGAPEAAIRLQVRLRIGRLTLGLTVADRWECSQATGLPAWRHQDLHTSQRIGQHGITGTQTVESVIRYWSRLDQPV